MLTTRDFDFHLDPARIAQTPCTPRDASKLLVFHRTPDRPLPPRLEHRVFRDLPDFFQPGDTLVLNRSRVIPARLFGERVPSGGKVEILLIRPVPHPSAPAPQNSVRWNCLMHAKAKLKPGDPIRLSVPTGSTPDTPSAAGKLLPPAVTATLIERLGMDGDIVEFDQAPAAFESFYHAVGQLPLPPYIQRKTTVRPDLAPAPTAAELQQLATLDRERYQTVYAREEGSIAAPTAGLHFTPELLDRLRAKQVRLAELLLHVGPGTFRPVKAEHLADHPMHEEHYEISADCAAAIQTARATNRRVVAVGTTTLRALESACTSGTNIPVLGPGSTRLFVHPPRQFNCVDGLVTNFHLPKSTLLMLVSAFATPGATAGVAAVQAAYATAIAENYRFFSYGDAMLFL